MCVFCAAIPATLAVGVKLDAEQKRQRGEKPAPRQMVPVKPITAAAVAGLAVASLLYHSQTGG